MSDKTGLDPKLVEALVGAAHGDFDRVQALLRQEPGLLHAGWDWETALGAAAHMGRRDIAEFLLARGARIDLFAAAMMGKLEIVRAILADNSEARQAVGPHGIPLLAHARAGGPEAEEVVRLLL